MKLLWFLIPVLLISCNEIKEEYSRDKDWAVSFRNSHQETEYHSVHLSHTFYHEGKSYTESTTKSVPYKVYYQDRYYTVERITWRFRHKKTGEDRFSYEYIGTPIPEYDYINFRDKGTKTLPYSELNTNWDY
jgi:hypothetical protein